MSGYYGGGADADDADGSNPVRAFDQKLSEPRASVRTLLNAKVAYLRDNAAAGGDTYLAFDEAACEAAARKRRLRRQRVHTERADYVLLNADPAAAAAAAAAPQPPQARLTSQERRAKGMRSGAAQQFLQFRQTQGQRARRWRTVCCAGLYASLLARLVGFGGPAAAAAAAAAAAGGDGVVDAAALRARAAENEQARLLVRRVRHGNGVEWLLLRAFLARAVAARRARRQTRAADVVAEALRALRRSSLHGRLRRHRTRVVDAAVGVQRAWRTHRHRTAAFLHLFHRQWLRHEVLSLGLSWGLLVCEVEKDANCRPYTILCVPAVRSKHPALPPHHPAHTAPADPTPAYSPAGFVPFTQRHPLVERLVFHHCRHHAAAAAQRSAAAEGALRAGGGRGGQATRRFKRAAAVSAQPRVPCVAPVETIQRLIRSKGEGVPSLALLRPSGGGGGGGGGGVGCTSGRPRLSGVAAAAAGLAGDQHPAPLPQPPPPPQPPPQQPQATSAAAARRNAWGGGRTSTAAAETDGISGSLTLFVPQAAQSVGTSECFAGLAAAPLPLRQRPQRSLAERLGFASDEAVQAYLDPPRVTYKEACAKGRPAAVPFDAVKRLVASRVPLRQHAAATGASPAAPPLLPGPLESCALGAAAAEAAAAAASGVAASWDACSFPQLPRSGGGGGGSLKAKAKQRRRTGGSVGRWTARRRGGGGPTATPAAASSLSASGLLLLRPQKPAAAGQPLRRRPAAALSLPQAGGGWAGGGGGGGGDGGPWPQVMNFVHETGLEQVLRECVLASRMHPLADDVVPVPTPRPEGAEGDTCGSRSLFAAAAAFRRPTRVSCAMPLLVKR